jgi:hypothetical protein
MRLPWRMVAAPLGLLVVASIAGCATVADSAVWMANNVDFRSDPALARVTNLSDSSCRDSFSEQLTASLVKQGEPPDEANVISAETTAGLSYDSDSLLPRPFHVSSTAGHRYGFFVQSTKSGCVLRLYERQKGRWSSGNGSYDARRLTSCSCGENTNWPVGYEEPGE